MTNTPDLDRDIIEMSDDKGNTISFEIEQYFFYNGDQFALLRELNREGEPLPGDDAAYIVRVDSMEDEAGESLEEFSPVDEEEGRALLDLLRAERVDMMPLDEEE